MRMTRTRINREQDPHHSPSPGDGLADVYGPQTHVRSFRARDIAQEPLAAETTTLESFRARWRLVTDVDGTRWVPR